MTSFGFFSKLLVFSLQTVIWQLSSHVGFKMYSTKKNKQQTKKHRLIKLDLYLKCLALCSVVCPELQMLGSVPPSSLSVCACLHKWHHSKIFLSFLFCCCCCCCYLTVPCVALAKPEWSLFVSFSS